MTGDGFGEFLTLLQGGGNVALGIAVYFIYKAANRLSRIEKMLEIVIARDQGLRTRKTDIPPEINGGT